MSVSLLKLFTLCVCIILPVVMSQSDVYVLANMYMLTPCCPTITHKIYRLFMCSIFRNIFMHIIMCRAVLFDS